MVKTTLGRTGMSVTQLGFGGMELRGPKTWQGREIGDDEAGEILSAALDAGINFIDTSADYGLSEEFIGRHIANRRDEYFLATKCGCNPRDLGDHIETTPHVWTRDNILRNVEGSLARMRTGRVDLLQLHNPTPEEVRRGHLIATLQELQQRGLTRFIGISTTLPHVREFLDMGVFDTFQMPYSCLEPEHHEALTMVGQAGCGVIIRGGIAHGRPTSSAHRPDRDDLWILARLHELLGDMSATELILRYTLSHPHCHTAIVGTSSVAHLKENLAAAEKGPLPQELYDEVTQRVMEGLEARR